MKPSPKESPRESRPKDPGESFGQGIPLASDKTEL